MKLAALIVGLTFSLFVNAQMKYIEGTDYTTLKTPLFETSKPSITEFFWFGCPHCNDLRPTLENWLENNKPADLEFTYFPAVTGSPYWDKPAQAFFTMEDLGVTSKIFDDYFNAIHKDKDYSLMNDQEKIKAFFIKHGVSADDFDKTWNSFKVTQQMKEAADKFKASGLEGVPAFIVNGKYIVTAMSNFSRMIDIAQTLANE